MAALGECNTAHTREPPYPLSSLDCDARCQPAGQVLAVQSWYDGVDEQTEVPGMATITVRNLDAEPTAAPPPERSAQHGRSIEEEAHVILASTRWGRRRWPQ